MAETRKRDHLYQQDVERITAAAIIAWDFKRGIIHESYLQGLS
jgi:hypothetical protein